MFLDQSVTTVLRLDCCRLWLSSEAQEFLLFHSFVTLTFSASRVLRSWHYGAMQANFFPHRGREYDVAEEWRVKLRGKSTQALWEFMVKLRGKSTQAWPTETCYWSYGRAGLRSRSVNPFGKVYALWMMPWPWSTGHRDYSFCILIHSNFHPDWQKTVRNDSIDFDL